MAWPLGSKPFSVAELATNQIPARPMSIQSSFISALTGSPIYLTFLRRIDLGQFDPFVVEKDLHLVKEKRMRVRV